MRIQGQPINLISWLPQAVQLLADFVKRRQCLVPPHVLHPLAHLTFPDIAIPNRKAELLEQRKLIRKRRKKRQKLDNVARDLKEAVR